MPLPHVTVEGGLTLMLEFLVIPEEDKVTYGRLVERKEKLVSNQFCH